MPPSGIETEKVGLALEVERRDTWTLVRVAGDIDVSTAGQLRRALAKAIDDGQPLVVLDLSGVPFLDCFGIGVLVSTRARARVAGGDLRLVAPAPLAARLLDVCGLLHVFALADTAEEAVAAGE